jgi:hypothetical protein
MTVNRKPDDNEEIGVVNNERSGEESASPEVGRIHNERPGEVAADPEVGVIYNDADSDSESS